MSEKEALLPTKRILQPMLPLKVRKCAVRPDYLRSAISSRALAAFQNMEKHDTKEKLTELNV